MLSAGLAGLAWSPSLAVATVAVILAGAGVTLLASSTQAIQQHLLRDEVRGRVFAVFMVAFAGSRPVGSYLAGLLGSHFGIGAVLALATALCLALLGIGMVLFARSPRMLTP